jgi:hypothetical protein
MFNDLGSPTLNLQGASHITGGFAHGHAWGGVFGFANAVDMPSDNICEIYRKGEVLLYTSTGDVSIVRPKFSLKLVLQMEAGKPGKT